jgi:crotonobetainyl-CoA:carnitine CoA-transferase CaiB-like acyl-CoA transferase
VTTAPELPLAGITVVALGQAAAGPIATRHLVDTLPIGSSPKAG